MSKAEWGKKHECPNCSCRFYDLLKPSPLSCPKCDFVFAADILHKTRKGKAVKSSDDDDEDLIEEEDEDLLHPHDDDEDDLLLGTDDNDDDAVPGVKDDYSIDDDLILPDDDEPIGDEEIPVELLGEDLENLDEDDLDLSSNTKKDEK